MAKWLETLFDAVLAVELEGFNATLPAISAVLIFAADVTKKMLESGPDLGYLQTRYSCCQYAMLVFLGRRLAGRRPKGRHHSDQEKRLT